MKNVLQSYSNWKSFQKILTNTQNFFNNHKKCSTHLTSNFIKNYYEKNIVTLFYFERSKRNYYNLFLIHIIEK